MPTTRWVTWELQRDFQFQASLLLPQEARNSKVEVDLLASKDQVMEAVGRVAVKIERFLRWKIWEWQLGSME
jgi:hypothetical protein